MAQETIALTITLNGQERIITSIGDLAKVIKQAQSEIAILKEKGDETWRSYEKELDKVINKYNELNRSVKGTNFDRQIDSFLRFGNLVTQVFGAATIAVNIFGGDSESAAKRQAQAQEILALAFTVASIAKEKDTIKTAFNTAANIANTLATQGVTAATKALTTALKANPWVLVATLIAGATAALIDWGGENEKELERLKELKGLYEGAAGAIRNVVGEQDILFDKVETLVLAFDLGKIAFDEFEDSLRSLIPGFEDLDMSVERNLNALKRYIEESRKLTIVNTQIAEAEKLRLALAEKGEFFAELQQKNFIERKTIEQAQLITSVNSYKKYIDGIIKGEKDRETLLKELEENRKKRQLAEIKRLSDLRKEYIGLLEIQQVIGELDIDLSTQAQIEYYETLSKVTQDYLTVGEKLGEFNRDLYEKDIQAIRAAEIELTNSGQKITNTFLMISKGFELAATDLDQNEFAELFKKALEIEQGGLFDVEEQINNRRRLLEFERKFIEDYVKSNISQTQLTGQALVDFTKYLEEEGGLLFEVLSKNQKELVVYGLSVDKTTKKLDDLTDATRKLRREQSVLSGFIKENQKDIIEEYDVYFDEQLSGEENLTKLRETLRTKDFDIERNFAADILNLQRQLKSQGLDISGAGYEEQLKLLEGFLLKQKKRLEDDPPRFDWPKIRKEFIDGLNQIQGALNSYAQLTSSYYQNQLNALENQNERTQSQIIGTTEEANQKRLEAEEIYQEKRKEIEKRAAKSALQISLAQAVANAAAAIVRITEQTGVLAPIAATIVAGINVAQIAQIRAQISAIDSFAKGGFIKGQGGLVVGPSHEFGGVKYASGGVELEGGEAVINRLSSVRYAPLLSEINQAGGGKPLVVNNFDDSRIVEAIAKQRTQPLRAYVLEQDITQRQQVQKRLEQLAQI
jgi:hypothetical protein